MQNEIPNLPINPTPWYLNQGIQMMLLATICFTIMQTFVKELKAIHTFQITFFRSAITSACCFFYLFYHRLPVTGTHQKLLVLRAILGIISMTSFFLTLQLMPFGASVSLKYLSPIFAAIFSIFLLKETIKPLQWIFFGIAIIGVLFLKGFDDRIEYWALIIALTGALAGGLIYPLIRKIGNREHPMIIINYFMFLATILLGVFMIPYWKYPSSKEWILLGIVGLSGFAAQVYMTKAFQTEEVSLIAPLKYLEVVYALLIGLIWYGESYSFWSFIGIILIVLAMFFNIQFKNRFS